MSTIYLVVAGEYSAYHIVALFSTPESAQRVADAIQGRVEAWDVDPDCVLPSMPRYTVQLDRETGEVLTCAESVAQEEATLKPYRSPMYSLHYWPHRGRHQYLIRVDCYAQTSHHAVTIAQDLRAEINAQDSWRFFTTKGPRACLTDEQLAHYRTQEAEALLKPPAAP